MHAALSRYTNLPGAVAVSCWIKQLELALALEVFELNGSSIRIIAARIEFHRTSRRVLD